MDSVNVVVVSADLSSKLENVLKSQSSDSVLVETMDEYVEKFKNENIELFERYDNILVTEQGYYLSVFESDLKLLDDE